MPIHPFALDCAPWFIAGGAVVLYLAARMGAVKSLLGAAFLAVVVAAAIFAAFLYL